MKHKKNEKSNVRITFSTRHREKCIVLDRQLLFLLLNKIPQLYIYIPVVGYQNAKEHQAK